MPSPLAPVLAAAEALTEDTSLAMVKALQIADIATPLADEAIPTAYTQAGEGDLPLLLIHGFDSSQLEFRRLWPRLAAQSPTWTMDLLGFGFSDRARYPQLSPAAIKTHLYHFWQQMIGRPMVLMGASMGGAAALDFALTYPEAVAGLVLLDSAGLAAGPAMGKFMMPPLDSWATAFLRSPKVRRNISRSAYFDKAFVTADAELCAALHLDCPGWKEALIAFTKSGGYNFLGAKKVAHITQPSLVIWGQQDKILGTKDATRFEKILPQGKLVWMPNCGHVPHLEKPEEAAAAISDFLKTLHR